MTQKIMISPGRYVQGPGAIRQLGQQVKNLGKRAFVIGDRIALPLVRDDVQQSLQEHHIDFQVEEFGGECSMPEINRLKSLGEESRAQIIIGIGGGKTLDTAKAVAYYLELPVVVVPTIASTDAPCSALSVIYTPEGVVEKYLVYAKNPDLVLVDTGIVAKAPVRLLVAGMGDALATWFEADASVKGQGQNMPGGAPTQAALALARLCYELLIEHGYRAMLAVEKGVVTEDVEKVVEACTLLSGLGFESGGLAAAHAIHNGFTVLPETHECYHGEKVAFGTLVQMVLENRSNEELYEVLEFCVSVGLPVTLEEIGIIQVTSEKIKKVAEMACAPEETIHNMPFPVTPDMVAQAILAADALGQDFLHHNL